LRSWRALWCLKDVEIIVMSDEEYGEHLDQLFERVRRGEIREPEPHKIVTRTAEDIACKDSETQGIKCA